MLKFEIISDEQDNTVAMLTYMEKLLIKFVDLNEGYHGDYNPDDPDDCQLLRFDIYRLGSAGYEPVEDASYCTQLPVGSAPDVILKRALDLAYAVYDALMADASIKRTCEKFSWMSADYSHL